MATAKKPNPFPLYFPASRGADQARSENIFQAIEKQGCCFDIMGSEVRQAAAVRFARMEESPGPIEQDAG